MERRKSFVNARTWTYLNKKFAAQNADNLLLNSTPEDLKTYAFFINSSKGNDIIISSISHKNIFPFNVQLKLNYFEVEPVEHFDSLY